MSHWTADRLVVKHESSLNPDSNCTTDPISEPTEEEIKSLLDKIAPKLRRVLRTPASAFHFVDLLATSFALERRLIEGDLLIAKPSQKTEPAQPVQEAQHEPVDSPVEPVPVVADAPAECDGGSTEISA